MSARAALRLETLGFSDVYRYTPGKADWSANGLPTEGKLAGAPRVADVANRDVPTCRHHELIGGVQARVAEAGWDQCVVVGDGGVVLGRLRGQSLKGDPQAPVDDVMEPGPTTYRPDVDLATTVEQMRKQKAETLLVTTSDGVLIGSVDRREAERRLEEIEHHHHHHAAE